MIFINPWGSPSIACRHLSGLVIRQADVRPGCSYELFALVCGQGFRDILPVRAPDWLFTGYGISQHPAFNISHNLAALIEAGHITCIKREPAFGHFCRRRNFFKWRGARAGKKAPTIAVRHLSMHKMSESTRDLLSFERPA